MISVSEGVLIISIPSVALHIPLVFHTTPVVSLLYERERTAVGKSTHETGLSK
jgi:hypothetical protein